MTGNFINNRKQEHDEVLGYEVRATQFVTPFLNGWYVRSYGNVYSLSDTSMSIRHYYGFNNRARWLNIRRYKSDTHYTVEIFDSIEIDGEFYDRRIYKKAAYTLRDAIHLMNVHKSDQ